MCALKIIGYPDYTIELKDCNEGCKIMSYRRKNPREMKIQEGIDQDGYKRWNIVLYNEQGKAKTSIVSRLIVQHFKPNEWNPDLQVDHIDINSLNNSLDNLQMVTNLQNCNKRSTNPNRDNKSSGHKNIHYRKVQKRWIFHKTIKGVRFEKCFKTLEEAIHYKNDYLIKNGLCT